MCVCVKWLSKSASQLLYFLLFLGKS